MSSPSDYVFSFLKEGKKCLVVWSRAKAPHEVKIPALDGVYGVTSCDGQTQTEVTAEAGVIALTIDGGPQYLKRQ